MKKTASKPKHENRDQKQAEPRGQPQPNPIPVPTATAAAAVAPPAPATVAPLAPAAVALRPSGSSDSASSSSSSSSSTSLPEYGEGTLDTTSTSTSTATLKTEGGGKAAGSKRRRSDTTYPSRRKGSSSTDTGTESEPLTKTGTKFWLYTVVAIMLTIATASAIGMSLRAAEAATDEPPEYTLPKRLTTTIAQPPQCNCANGDATANPDANVRRQLTSSSKPGRRRRRAKTESPDKAAAASGGNTSEAERLNAEDDEDAVPEDGVPQKKVAGKATRSLVAFKIGPGRRKNAGEPSTSPTPAILNHIGARTASQSRAKLGKRDPTTKSRTTLKNAARKNHKTVTATSRTSTPRPSKTTAHVKPDVEEAAVWEQERPLVKGERRSPSAAAKSRDDNDTPEVGALNAAAVATRRRRGAH